MSHTSYRFRFPILLGVCLGLVFPLPLRAQVTIPEFMASNGTTLADEDGEFSDWIELYNAGTETVNLLGWSLTDDPALPTQWIFPSVNLAPRGFLVVFASGKDRRDPSGPLHCNFSLAAEGEYLALTQPDGVTKATEFSPTFPLQYRDLSYGVAQQAVTNMLVSVGDPVRIHVPSGALPAANWKTTAFDDSGWMAGVTGVGYQTAVPGFAVRNVKAAITVDHLSVAEQVLANPNQQTGEVWENAPVLNYLGTDSEGHYGNNAVFPGHTIGVDIEDFVVEATATILLPSAGEWTFGVSSDDGFSLSIGSFYLEFPDPRGPSDTLGVFNVPAAGAYPLRLVYYERGGGSELELFAAPGRVDAWNSTAFQLVGDAVNGGLEVTAPAIATGGGHYDPFIATDLESTMKGLNASVLLRIPFAVSTPSALESLYLNVRYDDGWVAYLNGAEVARRLAPVSLPWNAEATAAHPNAQALLPEPINLSDQLSQLVTGQNVLAVHALNGSADDADFLFEPQLVEYQVQDLTWSYFDPATPGTVNGDGYVAVVADTKFTVDRGFFVNAFALEIRTETPDALIRYTTNGTAPTLGNGTDYTGPLTIDGTTVLRAAAFKAGFRPSNIDTQSYLFLDDVRQQSPDGNPPPGWPAQWGGNVVDYGMDPDIVNNPTDGPMLIEALESVPTFSLVMDVDDLFNPSTGIYANPGQDGRAWERPCSIELVYPDGTQGFQINAGVRIRGGFSRSTGNPKHAFRLFFRQEYGTGKLRYPLFGDDGTDEFDNLDLRTFQNYSWSFEGDPRGIFVRDQVNRDMQLAMGHQGERGDFCHLYINGQYWGLYNTCERPEASYGETYFGGQKEDYDVIKVEAGPYTINATDGNLDAWTRLYTLSQAGFASDAAYEFVQGNNPDGTRNPAYERLVEIDNLIDYMLIIYYGGNLDAPISNFLGNTRPNNFYGLRNRMGPDGFRFFVHDAEHTLLNVNENRTGPFSSGDSSVVYSNPQWVFQKLWIHPEFRLAVADHVQRHFFNGGILSPEGARSLFLARKNEIDSAVVAESARWGDAKRSIPLGRNNWLSTVQDILNNYLPRRSGIVLNQLRAQGLYPSVNAPSFSQHGGVVNPGFDLVVSAPAGTVYYTLDGSDPRLRGGAPSPTALVYTGPIALTESAQVKARTRNGTIWSAVNEAAFFMRQDRSGLALTEIMYHPAPGAVGVNPEAYEFIELKNIGNTTLDLGGVGFVNGLQLDFPVGTRLEPDAFLVCVADTDAFAGRYPTVTIGAVYGGRLANGGEALSLADPEGADLISLAYSDTLPWPPGPDGTGFSLVPVSVNQNPDPANPANWRVSQAIGGSPGRDDPGAGILPILINEVLTHTDPPQSDSIELRNPNDVAVDIGDWYLTDDRAVPDKFRIPSPTTIAPGGFVLFEETDFNPTPGVDPSFTLSSHGEEVWLYSADAQGNLTGYLDGFRFGAAANGVSFGRHVLSTGQVDYPAQQANSLSAGNTGPRLGPVVLSEIHYHPQPGDAEFIELMNITDQSVPLYHPDYPTNRWRLGGVGFTFPEDFVLPAHGLALVVGGDPATFRTRHSVPAEVPVFGPFPGSLQDNGERLELLRPDAPDVLTNGVVIIPEIAVDMVRYNDRAPWPTNAAGLGPSLERAPTAAYGNDPIHWRASPGAASPGLDNTGNRPPRVDAGQDQLIEIEQVPATINLTGIVTDDGQPNLPPGLTVVWSQIDGPGSAVLENIHQPNTTATLPGVGTYVFRLTASDTALSGLDEVRVTLTRAAAPLALIAPGATWRYWDQGTDLGSDWRQLGYSDVVWSSGPAQLGYGDGDETTTVEYGPNPGAKYITTYFRHTFNVTDAGRITSLALGVQRDDGAVVYLNGTEVFRSNMPEGTINFSTPANAAVGGAEETTFYLGGVDPSLLVDGPNLVAVEIHQANGTSSDISFDLELTGAGWPPNQSPTSDAGTDLNLDNPGMAMLEGAMSDDGLPIPPGLLIANWSQVNGPGTVVFTDPQAAVTAAQFDAPGDYLLRLSVSDGVETVEDDVRVTVGLAETFEEWQARNFSPAQLADPAISGPDADPDGDGHSNTDEFNAGTLPLDPDSALRVLRIEMRPPLPLRYWIHFTSVENRSYTIQYREDLTQGAWQRVANATAPAATTELAVEDPGAPTTGPRYYRIVTPAIP